ncbi:SAM-dependent methyltransferase [Streptococcus ruminantium]|uniref:SAM-dependent methyltransferase n=1 Tax=Streptococcus ruminantium TaxID=1917441 RepID=UPI0012DE2E91|nr:SAM-dependent methyltransferase [Streptococcus ruminantium]
MKYIITAQSASEPYVAKYVYNNFGTNVKWISKNNGIAVMDCTLSPIELNRFLEESRECFIRHLFPVSLENVIDGILLTDLVLETAHIGLDISESFSIQYRVLDREVKEDIHENIRSIKKELVAEGYTYDECSPKQIVSILISNNKAFIGANDAYLNRSLKNGGIIRYKVTDDFISRAEFKLLEIFDTCDFSIPGGAKALDIGAAPGGWTKALVNKGCLVYSVDPGRLSEKIISNKSVKYFQESAQRFLYRKLDLKFDFIVNDMKMDGVKSFQMMLEMMSMAKGSTNFIFTIKLPKKRWDAYLKKLLQLMDESVEVIFLRQLSYNRSEVMAVFRRKE